MVAMANRSRVSIRRRPCRNFPHISFDHRAKFGLSFLILLLLACVKSHVVSQSTAASSASCKRSRPPSNLVNGQELTMCDIVWISPQSHSSLSVKPYFLWHALQWPWHVRKPFSSDQWAVMFGDWGGNSGPGGK